MAKKSFMNADNPAMQFISASSHETENKSPAAFAEDKPVTDVRTSPSENKDIYDISPRSPEHKSKRAQLLMTPSLHEKAVKKAASLNMSFNELVNLLLENYLK